ncbi:MAG TPA: MYXO-CTERM sorting domain-containing protein, partial [Myxococcaceae bacterium]|nr:MYXO-CTERM sorting domain-containing protein [Myxococcaceae bacterium]
APWNAIAADAGLFIDLTVNQRGGSGGTDAGGGTTPDSGNPGGGGGPGPGVGDAPPGSGSNCNCGTADAGAIAALLAVVALAGRRRARRLICGPKPR